MKQGNAPQLAQQVTTSSQRKPVTLLLLLAST
jgi:hypothetical protein